MPRSESNPFDAFQVVNNIHDALKEYLGKYEVVILPNIVDVVYGRDVGWTVSKIDLPPEIEAISATKIRNNELDVSIEKQLQIIEKTAVQKQWDITFNGTKYELDADGQPMWNGGHGGEA
jgi:hypothetical protein